MTEFIDVVHAAAGVFGVLPDPSQRVLHERQRGERAGEQRRILSPRGQLHRHERLGRGRVGVPHRDEIRISNYHFQTTAVVLFRGGQSGERLGHFLVGVRAIRTVF